MLDPHINTLLYQRGQMQSFVNHHTVGRVPAFLHRAFCLLQEGRKTKFCGFPGNSHDAIIFKSTNLWDALQNGLLPNIAKVVGEVSIPPLIVGDSAFPLQSWLMKPYTNATLSPKQRHFNYRLSRARMVTEGAYGQLKGRWRVLFRKNESNKERVRTVTLACMVLHNICIERGDSIARKLDLSVDPSTQEKRDREEIRKLLQMTDCRSSKDTSDEAVKCEMLSARNCG